MPFENETIKQLIQNYQPLWSLGYLRGLAHWDLNTYMPRAGAKVRGKALGHVQKLEQQLILDKKFASLIRKATKQKDLNDYEQGVVRLLQRTFEYYEKLPAEFVEQLEQTTNEAHTAWEKAKEKEEFTVFAPHLKKIIELSLQKAEYLGYNEHPYDALLDLYEEGLTSKDVEQFFKSIRGVLIDLLTYIQNSTNYKDPHPLQQGAYQRGKLKKLNQQILEDLQQDKTRLRLDLSAHPFTMGLAHTDIRITTRYSGKNLAEPLTSTVHEFGHALYYLQGDDRLACTPIYASESLGLHESQSRFWENFVVRSRTFIDLYYDQLVGAFKNANPSKEELYQYFNNVAPGLIRTQADEITYHFHIMIRFEIEKKLMEQTIKIEDLQEVWRTKYKEYLGVVPEKDSQGVLQDIHWSQGAIGYFPTYSTGTVLSATWKKLIEKEVGKIEELIKSEQGVKNMQAWLKDKIHQYGSTYTFKQLVKKVSGAKFSSEPWQDYLKAKYKEIF